MKIIIYVIILILFTSCIFSSRSVNNKTKTFEVSKMKNPQKIKLSDLNAVNIEYIPLETNTLSLISEIRKIKNCDDFFLVINFSTILKFKKDGTFLTKIGQKGKGPSEFLNAHCVAINPENNDIYIVSGWENKIYVYSKNNVFLKSFNSPTATKKIEFIGKDILCYSPNTDGTVINSYNLINTNGKIIKSFSNKYPYKSQDNTIFYQNENIFFKYQDQLFKKEIYSDTVYVFENFQFHPKYILNQGNATLTPKARENKEPIQIAQNYITQRNLFMIDNKIFYEYSKNGKRLCFIGSTKNKWQVNITEKQGLINDIDGGLNFQIKTCLKSNTIISWITPLELKKHITTKKFQHSIPKYPEKKKKLEELANRLNNNDNPVLVLVALKE